MSRLPVRKKIAYFRMRVLVIATEVLQPCLPAVFLKIWILDIYLCLLPSMAMKDRKDGRWIVSRPEIYSVVYVVVNGRTD